MSTRNECKLVSDVMISFDQVPSVHKNEILKIALEQMGKTHLGIVCIIDEKKTLLGILTDGDIRRKILKVQKPFSALLLDDALDHSIRKPITISPDATLIDAVQQMGLKKIWDLPVLNAQGKLVGLLHLHPAVQSLLEISQ